MPHTTCGRNSGEGCGEGCDEDADDDLDGLAIQLHNPPPSSLGLGLGQEPDGTRELREHGHGLQRHHRRHPSAGEERYRVLVKKNGRERLEYWKKIVLLQAKREFKSALL